MNFFIENKFRPKNDQFIGSSELGEVVITLFYCFDSNPNQCLFDSFVSNKAGVVTKRNLCTVEFASPKNVFPNASPEAFLQLFHEL